MTRDLIDAGHHALAVKHHPDKPTGSVERMTRLNRARDVLVQRILDW
jgi:curved DNA-binding protein CbpA